MKIHILCNEQGYVTAFASIGELVGGVEAELPDDLFESFETQYPAYKLTDGALVFDADKLAADTDAAEISTLRARRETECFKYINRGQLWYARLTGAQLTELGVWYLKWLDITSTREIPERPAWLEKY